MEETAEASKNEFLRSKTSWDLAVISFFEDYGWYVLIFAIAVVYVLRRAQPTIEKYFKTKENEDYAAKYHKNPDLFAARAAAQEAAVQRRQQKYAEDAAQYQQKLEEKEAKKREEWLVRHNASSGHVLGNGSDKKQSSLKPESNPLMGSGSGSTYRPPRRSACSGGGCGR